MEQHLESLERKEKTPGIFDWELVIKKIEYYETKYKYICKIIELYIIIESYYKCYGHL